jgi:hypothetical protein
VWLEALKETAAETYLLDADRLARDRRGARVREETPLVKRTRVVYD